MTRDPYKSPIDTLWL